MGRSLMDWSITKGVQSLLLTFCFLSIYLDVDFDQLLRVLHEDVGELLQLRLVVRNKPVADDTPAKHQLDPHDGPR